MPRPKIFISHLHQDSEIAGVIKGHLVEWGYSASGIFLSSDAGAAAPRIGGSLSEELAVRQVL